MKAETPALGLFQIIKPPFEKTQEELLAWTTRCHSEADKTTSGREHASFKSPASGTAVSPETLQKLFRRYGVASTKISRRSFECPDIQSFEGWNDNIIYNFKEDVGAGVSSAGVPIRKRAEFFSERAQAVFDQFYPSQAELPAHLIHVTCTGYVSPSAAQLKAAGSSATAVTHAYHMGCYAALPAVRMAAAFVKASEDVNITADIVHTEMCGLHMNPSDHTPEQIVVQTLFADGHVKYSVKPSRELTKGFRILKILEEIVPESAKDMSWIPASWGMQMTLSREVPEKIAVSLRPFLQKLLADQELEIADVLKSAIFAIHPGGPKIIESVRNTLELSISQTAASDKILFERGNMSSATLPHVWDEILKTDPPSGTIVVSLAFGPGLTIFGAVFECL